MLPQRFIKTVLQSWTLRKLFTALIIVNKTDYNNMEDAENSSRHSRRHMWQRNRLHVLTIEPYISRQLLSNSSEIPERIDRVDQWARRRAYGWCACAVTLEVGRSKFVGHGQDIIYHTYIYLSRSFRTGGSGCGAAYNYRYRNGDHKSWALLSLATIPSLSSLRGLRVSLRVEKRMRMRNRVDWIKSSRRLRSDAGQLHFLWKKFPPSGRRSRTNLGDFY